jgi:DNA-binding CsgD family transcriptional regulator
VAHAPLVGREQEVGRITAWVAGLRDGPKALTLSGEGGIGKTVLWELAVDTAVSSGARVLRHRSVEAEAKLSFTGLTDLMTTALDEVADRLLPPRRHALEVALLLADPEGSPPSTQAIGLAVLDAFLALTEEAPLVIALDDRQWLDASTAAVLGAALRHVDRAPLGVLITRREAPGTDELLAAIPQHHIALAPLDLSDLHRLVDQRLGLVLSRPELTRVLQASRGNPLFALELCGQRRGAASSEDAATPASLSDALGRRLEHLPPESLDRLLAVALLARPTVELVVAAGASVEMAASTLEAARRGGVVDVDGNTVRFSHPLLAARCIELATPWRRRAVHRALADVVGDPEERARHLALGCEAPNVAIAALLDRAAERAAARGAPAAAAELAELAAASTPRDVPGDNRRRRIAAADLHRIAGDTERAGSILDAVLAETQPGPVRARLLYRLACTGRDDVPTRASLCEQALDETPVDDPSRVEILGLLALARWVQGDAAGALRDARAAVVQAEQLHNPRTAVIAGARLGLIESWAGEITPGALERAVEMEAVLDAPLDPLDSPAIALARRLYDSDELNAARALLERLDAIARRRGDEVTRRWTLLLLLGVERHAGAWDRAASHAAHAREIAQQGHELQVESLVARASALLETDRGHADAARRHAEEGLRLARAIGDETLLISNLAALGYLELALGRAEAAAEHLRDLHDRQERVRHMNPSTGRWPDGVEALVKIGDLDAARTLHDRLEDVAARRNRWARIGAARSAGLVTAAGQDPAAAIPHFERALAEDKPPTYPLERARTLLALGATQRRAKLTGAAGETLRGALLAFETLDAPLWAQQAREELTRVGRRVRARGDLTGTEARVAELVAAGRRNREVAAALFLTVRTVEAILTRVYRKLDVRSRAELAHLYAARDDVSPSRPAHAAAARAGAPPARPRRSAPPG